MKFVHAPLKGDQQRLHVNYYNGLPMNQMRSVMVPFVLRVCVVHLDFVMFVAVCEAIRLVTYSSPFDFLPGVEALP